VSAARLVALALALLLAVAAEAPGMRLGSYPIVNGDGSLNVRGYRLRLYGIAIPPSPRTCRTIERPPVCDPQAAIDGRIIDIRRLPRPAPRSGFSSPAAAGPG
jgi:hypothetical protein